MVAGAVAKMRDAVGTMRDAVVQINAKEDSLLGQFANVMSHWAAAMTSDGIDLLHEDVNGDIVKTAVDLTTLDLGPFVTLTIDIPAAVVIAMVEVQVRVMPMVEVPVRDPSLLVGLLHVLQPKLGIQEGRRHESVESLTSGRVGRFDAACRTVPGRCRDSPARRRGGRRL